MSDLRLGWIYDDHYDRDNELDISAPELSSNRDCLQCIVNQLSESEDTLKKYTEVLWKENSEVEDRIVHFARQRHEALCRREFRWRKEDPRESHQDDHGEERGASSPT